jgi:hypothetical protein
VVAVADLSGSRIAFYATVATVLPIVMLALAVQLRAREILWQGGRLGKKTALLVVFLGFIWVLQMGWAELNALFSLADDRNESYTWVITGAGVGCIILVVGTLDAVGNQLLESYKKDREAKLKETVERVVRHEFTRAVETEVERRSTAESDKGSDSK